MTDQGPSTEPDSIPPISTELSSVKLAPKGLDDLVEHVRTIHFAMLVVSLVLITAATQDNRRMQNVAVADWQALRSFDWDLVSRVAAAKAVGLNLQRPGEGVRAPFWAGRHASLSMESAMPANAGPDDQ